MRKNLLVVFLSVVLVSTNMVVWAKGNVVTEDSRFDRFKDNFVLRLWNVYPSWASSVGYHKYDSVLVVPNDESRENEVAFCEKYLDSLSRFSLKDLSESNQIDYHLIENQLKYAIWSIQEQKAWKWDPSGYNVSNTFAEMLANKYDKPETRIHNFYVKMAAVPAYYEAAKACIKHPSREHLKLAIEQNKGGISVFEKDLPEALKSVHLSADAKKKIEARAKTAVNAIKNYVSWLEDLEDNNPRSFRLGKALYDKKFAFELQSAYTPDEIYNKANRRKTELHEDMYILTRNLWPKYFPYQDMPRNSLVATKMMIDKISKKHVKRDSFQSAIQHQLPELVKFINKKGLLYIDPSKPLVVRKEPDYMAGVAGASITSPGPYDKNGNTYYNVGSLSGWSDEKAESYLREYNHYILQILDIHEAIPGHYTQLVYANKSKSMIKSLFGNNAMIEGWAVYTERMMLENGYDGDQGVNSKEASPEMWLMYDKWHLRSVCNTILDYSVHTKNMTKEQAMKLLVDEAFQQKAEAEGKWKRVSVTQVQLCCYFTGFTEIYSLRSKLMNRLEERFDLKKFHEQFLSYGSAPVKYISKMMLSDKKNMKPVSPLP